MKKALSLIMGLTLGAIAIAQPPKGPANSGMTFGEKTDSIGAININDLEKTVSATETSVKIKGKVTDVCTMEGCWLKMETASGKMMVKMKDHAFLVPVDLNGKHVVIEGTASMKVTSVKELKHYAEDAGKSQEEIAKITVPKKEIVVNAKGVLVL